MKIDQLLFILIAISCPLLSLPLRAQDPKSVTISGTVKEDSTLSPIPYATIAVIDSEGKTSGAVTAESGDFKFTTTLGDKKVVISCLGYVKYTTKLRITESIELGDIVLKPEINELSEVVVKGSRQMITREIDKLVIDAKSLSSIGSNAIDLLKQTPGLLVSEEGKISVIGKGKIIVLVNG